MDTLPNPNTPHPLMPHVPCQAPRALGGGGGIVTVGRGLFSTMSAGFFSAARQLLLVMGFFILRMSPILKRLFCRTFSTAWGGVFNVSTKGLNPYTSHPYAPQWYPNLEQPRVRSYS